MKKIQLICLFIFLLNNVSSKAQTIKFGVKAGVNFANFSGSDVNTSTLTSFHGGFISEVKIFKNFAIQPEIFYSTQGAKVDNVGQELKNELGYVSIPVLAKFYLADDFSFELGPQASFLLSERNNVSTNDSNTFDFAVAAGLSYKVGKHFFVSGRYSLGLTEPKRDASIKNTLLQGSLGYLF